MPEFQCAFAARERHEPMFATASQVRRWLLIEVRGSWGRDSIANTDLARHASAAWKHWLRREQIRVVAIRRDLDRGEDRPVQMFFVAGGSGREPGRCWRQPVAGLHAAVSASWNLPPPDATAHDHWVRHDEPLVLVCTNGKHDACCATFGRPLVRELRRSEYAGVVWECSHVGGDRFAANVVILPDGLYFGRCDAASTAEILDGYRLGQIALDQYRGKSTLGYIQQAVDYFVRRQLGVTATDGVRSIRRAGERAANTFTVEVVGESGTRRTVDVAVRRTRTPAPTPLTCTGAPGLEVAHYELLRLEERR